jgi:DNA mismatch repair ATPase MutS
VHRALERWKAESGARLRGWLEALGEIEALAALASLAHDHPDWCFPVPVEEPRLTARALAHPLLAPGAAVTNDVEVGPAGTFLLVTGSNMSGKSTLLRALAMNVVLGSAGAPVCAAEMRLPPVSLQTSIRVQDSLEEGVSLFMAELLALARVVAAARTPSERRVLYLLDEILQGTNSGDRRLAARTVLLHLLAAGAIGAVTTHDLALAAAPQLETHAVTVHFTETVIADGGSPRLVFDYRLRPGLATTRNALVLLEMVGLGPVDSAGPSAGPEVG